MEAAGKSICDLAATTAEVSGSGDSNFRVGGGRIGAFGVTLDGFVHGAKGDEEWGLPPEAAVHIFRRVPERR